MLFIVLLSLSCVASGRTGLTGSIQFGFKLEVESVQFNFKNSSRVSVQLGFDKVSKANGVDEVNGIDEAELWGR